MKKVVVKICAGTSCFVMGAAQIQALEFTPPEDIADKIELVEVRCMNLCKDTTAKYNRGPFVMVFCRQVCQCRPHSFGLAPQRDAIQPLLYL